MIKFRPSKHIRRVNFAIFSDSFGLIMKKYHGDIQFFSCYVKEILLSLLCKIRNFLEKNFVYGQISKFLSSSECLLDSHILRLNVF